MINGVYLKLGAQDIEGNQLDTRKEYQLIFMSKFISIISNGYKNIAIKTKYIKKPRA